MSVRFKPTSWEQADDAMFGSSSQTRFIRNSSHSTYQNGYEYRNEDEEVFVPASYTKPRTTEQIEAELEGMWKWLEKSREEYK